MTRRREFLAGLAGVSVAAGAVVVAVASPDPDAALLALVDDLRKATAEVERTVAAWFEATNRAEADYPPDLPPWHEWRIVNHPAGRFEPYGGTAVLTAKAQERVDAFYASFGGELPNDVIGAAEYRRVVGDLFRAGDLDEAAHYAGIKPRYDSLTAERTAAVAAIDVRENVPALTAANEAAEARQKAALAALLACRPVTASGFLAKVAAILGQYGDPAEAIGDDEARALLADIAALAAGGVA